MTGVRAARAGGTLAHPYVSVSVFACVLARIKRQALFELEPFTREVRFLSLSGLAARHWSSMGRSEVQRRCVSGGEPVGPMHGMTTFVLSFKTHGIRCVNPFCRVCVSVSVSLCVCETVFVFVVSVSASLPPFVFLPSLALCVFITAFCRLLFITANCARRCSA